MILTQTINGTDTSLVIPSPKADKTSSADVTVTIEAVNDAPSIDTSIYHPSS